MARKSQNKKKRNSKKNNSSFSKLISFFIVVFALFYVVYKTVPAVQQFTDEKIAEAKVFVQKNFPDSFEQPSVDSVKSEQDAQSAQNQMSKEAAQSALPAESTQSVSPAKNGYIALPVNLEKPWCPAQNHKADHELRNYEYYSICYRENYEQAEWSAYCLTSDHLVKNAGRSDDFRPDPEISTGSATLADYKGSGYDRGHLSPAADFAFDKTAMSETFYMSNMSPQAGSFNRGMWKDLESSVRDWAKKFGRVYVISGPVLDKDSSEYETIGANKVSIPQYYYKVILAPLYEDENDAATPEDAKAVCALAFIFPNKKCEGSFFDYAVTIDEVEKRTGLDFFSQFDEQTQNSFESSVVLQNWQ